MKLSDLQPDPHNANVGTFRGKTAVEVSLATLGAGRSIVTDKNGVVLAGNKTAAAARSAGLDDEVILVQSDGSKLVVVQRTDLLASDIKAQTLAVADNRTAEIGLEWDADVLKELSSVEGLDLKPYFATGELEEITNPITDIQSSPLKNETLPSGYGVMIENISEQQQLELLERFTQEGYTCKALTF